MSQKTTLNFSHNNSTLTSQEPTSLFFFGLLIILIVCLIFALVGIIIKKYKDMKKENAQLKLQNIQLQQQLMAKQQISCSGAPMNQTTEMQTNFDDQQMQGHDFNGIHNLHNLQLEKSSSHSITPSSKIETVLSNSPFNFSPDNYIQDGRKTIQPSMFVNQNDPNLLSYRNFKNTTYSTPYNMNVVSPLHFLKTQSLNRSHERDLADIKNTAETLQTLANRKQSHILIEDQEMKLKNEVEEQNYYKCKRNLFDSIESHHLGTSSGNEMQSQNHRSFLKEMPQVGQFQEQYEDNLAFMNSQNDTPLIFHQTSLERPLALDRQILNRYRQASLQKESYKNSFKLPQSMRQNILNNNNYRNSAQSQNRILNSREQVFSPQFCSAISHSKEMGNKSRAQEQIKFNQQIPLLNLRYDPRNPNSHFEEYSPQINPIQYPHNQLKSLSRKASSIIPDMKMNAYSNRQKYEDQIFEEDQIKNNNQYVRQFENNLEEDARNYQEMCLKDVNSPFDQYQESLKSHYSDDDNHEKQQDFTSNFHNYLGYPQFGSPKISHTSLGLEHLLIDLKHQQSASPQIPKLCSKDLFSLKSNQFNLEKRASYDERDVHCQSVVERRVSQELDERNKENFPCLLYLENGRYRNSFEEICFLGRGGFGVAHKVRHKLDSNFYAIKKIRLHLGANQDIKEHKVYREIMALPQLNHKNVVRYFGCWAERILKQEEVKIDERVEKIKKKLSQRRKLLKEKIINKKNQFKFKGLNKQSRKNLLQKQSKQLSQLDEEEDDVQEIVQINDINVTDDLEDAFENKSTYSQDIEEDEEMESNSENEQENQQSEDGSEQEDYKSYYSHSSEEEPEESDNLSISDLEDSDEDEHSHMEKFDDDALIEFIKLDQKFVSIDLMIQMEYCSGQTLQQHLEAPARVVDRFENFSFFKQLLSAVKHIHQHGFIHRDLKPANIFIEGSILKIGDFGLARKFTNLVNNIQKIQQALSGNQKISPKAFKKISSIRIKEIVKSASTQSLLTSQVGTGTYLSPEQETNKQYNEKVDIYALGLILCEMCSKFSTLHERISTLNELKYYGKLPQSLVDRCPIESQIILQMTNKDPEKRPNAQDLLKSPLIEQWGKLFAQNVFSPREPLNTSLPDQSQKLPMVDLNDLNISRDNSIEEGRKTDSNNSIVQQQHLIISKKTEPICAQSSKNNSQKDSSCSMHMIISTNDSDQLTGQSE